MSRGAVAGESAPNARPPRSRARWSARRVFDLLVFRTYADLRAEVERTYLGFVWWVLEPLMFMAVFYVVFGVMRGVGGVEYIAMLLAGLVMWQWIKSGISHSTDSINNSLFLMRQVHVPAVLVPLMTIATDTVKFVFVLVVLLVAISFMGYPPHATWIQLPLVLLVALVVTIGAGTIAAAWCPLFPDLGIIIETLLLLLMFVSGVFFSRDEIPEAMQGWFFLNPVAVIIDSFRQVVLWHEWVRFDRLGVALLVGLGMCAAGWVSANALQRRYPKLSV
jgi:lipopolysaccharide transport system permease protein